MQQVPGGRGLFYQALHEDLIAFAEHQFALDQRQDETGTVRDHLKVAAARGSVAARRRLEGPPLPPEVAYIWDWFRQLTAARAYGIGGPSPISYPDIQAWIALTATPITPWEIGVLRSLDQSFLVTCMKADEARLRDEEAKRPKRRR